MKHQDLADAILAHVGRPNYQPVKPRVILKQLKLPADRATDLRRTIKRLAQEGKLQYGAGHIIRPVASATTVSAAASESVNAKTKPARPRHKSATDGTQSVTTTSKNVNQIIGTFRRMQGGFGFVTPRGQAVRDKDQDIYISQHNARDAASGDTVQVRLKGRPRFRGGKPAFEGEIVQILERETNSFVGTYDEQAGAGFVLVDGMPFSQPIAVGDPGAKNAKPGDKVVIEMVRFPSHVHDGEGVIVEVLGPRGKPGVDTLSIIREFNLPGPFAEDALEDARQQAEAFDVALGEFEVEAGSATHTGKASGTPREGKASGTPHHIPREDLTAETIVTIDPIDARDFDDAISLDRLDNGHWLLGVHIADVSHFVRAKSPLDREARERATSVYLPDRVIPMLPELISNNLASLQPNKVRFAKTAMIEFTADGAPVAAEYKSTAIRSARRFTYEEVDEYLADREVWKARLTPAVHGLLARMHELAMILRARRLKRGAIELTMQEVKIDLDRDGRVSGAHLVENTESHQIIEEFMLSANEAVARMLSDAGALFLRRVHQQPDPRKLQSLTEFVHELGLSSDSLESRFEIQRVLDAVKGQPEERAVNYAVLRSMQQAVYSPEEEGHYALASDHYCHFTSPIRRYPDLTVHRLLDVLAAKKKPRNDLAELAGLGEHCSQRERRAEAAERELVKVKLLDYLSKRIGEEMDAVVTGVQQFGLFAQGIELPAEGLVHVTSLQDDYYRYDKTTHSLNGYRKDNVFRLGDVVRVAVARVDVDRRELDFRIVAREGRAVQSRERKTGGSDGRQRRGSERKEFGSKKKSKRGPRAEGSRSKPKKRGTRE
ncbi:MAG: ribonuclease R [Planctomycetota bacterium]|nr:MAG: ribonuclease R [Planctomycetota bacterium]